MDIADFAANLRQQRIAAGLTQAELAARLGMAQAEISLIETGKRVPRLTTICAIAKALDLTPAELLTSGTTNKRRKRP